MTEQTNDEMVMKLLHYFITEKDYNPIILQGVENEIWLENNDNDYKKFVFFWNLFQKTDFILEK